MAGKKVLQNALDSESYDDYAFCIHEDAEVDWRGRAECSTCGHIWWMTADEHDRQLDAARRAEQDFDTQLANDAALDVEYGRAVNGDEPDDLPF